MANAMKQRLGVSAEQLGTSGEPATGPIAAVLEYVDAGAKLLLPRYSRYFASLLGLESDDVYLDVACGSGVFLRRRAGHVHRVAGIDHTRSGIGLARRLLRKRLDEGSAQLVLADAVELPWPDATFTAASCNCLDCFAPGKPAQTVAEMHRVLRPGGRVVIGLETSMSDPESAIAAMHPILRPVGRVLARVFAGSRYEDPGRARAYEQRTGMSMFTDEEFTSLLEDAGFTQVSLPAGTWSRFATARRE